MHRIFIAINLPEDIKERLAEYQNRFDWDGLDWTRRTSKENLHITLEFIGNVSDKELEAVFQKAEEYSKKTPIFEVNLNKIRFFPNEKMPKYIFATGGEYHVTLARIREWQWRRMNPEERPDIEEEIDLKFTVGSIEVMESLLSRGAPKYKALKSFALRK